jgi:hypothetical protein
MEADGHRKVMRLYSGCSVLPELQIESVTVVVSLESVESRVAAMLISSPFL